MARICHLAGYVEPVLFMAVQQYVESNGDSISNYLRTLVVNDLLEKGVITSKTLKELVTATKAA